MKSKTKKILSIVLPVFIATQALFYWRLFPYYDPEKKVLILVIVWLTNTLLGVIMGVQRAKFFPGVAIAIFLTNTLIAISMRIMVGFDLTFTDFQLLFFQLLMVLVTGGWSLSILLWIKMKNKKRESSN